MAVDSKVNNRELPYGSSLLIKYFIDVAWNVALFIAAAIVVLVVSISHIGLSIIIVLLVVLSFVEILFDRGLAKWNYIIKKI